MEIEYSNIAFSKLKVVKNNGEGLLVLGSLAKGGRF